MVMHRLRLLSLGGSCQTWSFLERWQLPVLEELHISGNPYDQERGPFSPTFPALKKVEWFDAESDPTPADNQSNNFLLGRVLATSPELQSLFIFTENPSIFSYLTIRKTHGQPTNRISPFLATDDATGAPKYCLNLQELRLQEAGFGELERLAELRPRLEKVELVALRHNSISPSPLEEDRARLERVKERVEVIFQEWVS
ncbi:hypothetical protein M407DRAFT_31901 [Tulasnella calospora MUT 4182]|uniref:U2A'/phosphoprotein 32 family A C-terminal domain-containing protein n=1 Tax=Tulasnella calospora MUT 4182 TaxID=1051891 RepID=A0A0C3LAF0_9AGAM|nr:hypothetical protein M407DRAFT_31901 [Tulasnella calospora MUT 4182]